MADINGRQRCVSEQSVFIPEVECNVNSTTTVRAGGKAMATRLHVASIKGVWTLKSDDSRTWELEHESLGGWTIPKLAVSSSRPNLILAGTRGDGVWVSEDFGKKWRKPSYGKRGPGKVRSVMTDPRDPNIVYAGTEPIDLFVSHDLAKNWRRVKSLWDIPSVPSIVYPVDVVEPHVRDIAIDPINTATIYAALQVGFMAKSTDAGESWKLLDNGLDADVHTIVVDSQNPTSLFVATGGHQYRSGRSPGRALYRSVDGGDSWMPTAMDFPHDYSVPLVMHPLHSNVLFAALAKGHPGFWRDRPAKAESVIIKTADSGRTWKQLDGKASELNQDFPEALAIDSKDPNHVYAALKSGNVYRSEDSGNTWESLGIRVHEVTDMKSVND
jgi:photosystem II stability/assembly factor-like uncharacterized protein